MAMLFLFSRISFNWDIICCYITTYCINKGFIVTQRDKKGKGQKWKQSAVYDHSNKTDGGLRKPNIYNSYYVIDRWWNDRGLDGQRWAWLVDTESLTGADGWSVSRPTETAPMRDHAWPQRGFRCAAPWENLHSHFLLTVEATGQESSSRQDWDFLTQRSYKACQHAANHNSGCL